MFNTFCTAVSQKYFFTVGDLKMLHSFETHHIYIFLGGGGLKIDSIIFLGGVVNAFFSNISLLLGLEPF